MRWLVEVTSLATTEKESLHMDAETWQKALQVARSQRGDTGPMSGFSIELLDEGCRAVDPTSRMRYEVRRAPEQVASGSQPAPAPAPAAAAAAAPVSVPPRPGPHSQTGSRRPAPGSRTIMLGAAGSQAGVDAPLPSQPPPPVAAAPLAPAPAAAPIARSTPPPPPIVPVAPAILVPSVAPGPGPTPSTLRADVAANVPSQIVFKREQDATEAMPLTYREYIYGVPPGTTEAACETLLLTQLEFVRASLERTSAGKLVNLAVVDAPFDPKARTAPLATLNWKDWRGAPVVAFPRRPGYVPASSAAPQPAPPVIQAGQFAAVQAPALTPPPAAAFQPLAVQAPAAPAFVPAPAPVFVAPPPPPPPPPLAAPQVVAAPRAAAARVRGEDLVADLFEAMHDLHFLRDAIEGGEFCLTLAMEKLPYGAGIVHLYDIDRREFLVTNTRGISAEKLLLLRHPEDEPILSEAMRKRRALVIADAAHSEAAAINRYVTLGGVQSLIVAPVMQSGRFLGAVELLNPIDGQPFTEAEGNAVMYIADQLAEFVGERGVVTDPERIAPRKSPGT